MRIDVSVRLGLTAVIGEIRRMAANGMRWKKFCKYEGSKSIVAQDHDCPRYERS